MPGGNRTGPNGMGPMTGRGAGYCAGTDSPGYASGGSFGRGRGAGRGFRNRFFATGRPFWSRFFGAGVNAPPVDELGMLKDQAQGLKQSLDDIGNRIEELEKQ